MVHRRIRYNDIISTVWFDDKAENKGAIIVCYGLPGEPMLYNREVISKFVDEGFIVMCPYYIGTFDSFGICNFQNCVTTILETIDFLKKFDTSELWDLKQIKFDIKNIFLFGYSFGGSVALVAGAKSNMAIKMVVLAPPLNYRTQGRNAQEECIMDDYYRIKRGWINTWRIKSKSLWRKLHEGKLDLNAIDYIEILKNKDIFMIHGKNDEAVSFSKSVGFYEELKKGRGNHKLELIDNVGHLGMSYLTHENIFSQIIAWLDTKRS